MVEKWETWDIIEKWLPRNTTVRNMLTPSTEALFRWYAKRAAGGQTPQKVEFRFTGYEYPTSQKGVTEIITPVIGKPTIKLELIPPLDVLRRELIPPPTFYKKPISD